MFIYNFVVLLYGGIIKLASFRNTKAKQWVEGRKNWKKFYSEKSAALNSKNNIWIHCASYGEFEQGRPLIVAIKKSNPNLNIVLTFFSPSGYEVMKDWKGADIIGYLPLDTKSNAEEFIRIINPRAAIFIKYEFWLNFLFALQKNNVKNFLVSAVFKPHHPFFKWYGTIFRKSLGTFEKLFIQDHQSAKLLEQIGIKNYEVSGDTRFDRVIEVREGFKPIPFIESFCGDNKIIVAGSTWREDEELLSSALIKLKAPHVKLILVPHEINEGTINKITSVLKNKKISFAMFSKQKLNNEQVIIIDAFGILSRLYYYCHVAYIGGGFRDGIHNCLEPAVYLKPVVFGGNTHHKYNEAMDLLKMDVARNVMNEEEVVGALDHFLNNPKEELLKSRLENYFNEKAGTTKKVLQFLNLH